MFFKKITALILASAATSKNTKKSAQQLSTSISRTLGGKWADENINGKFSARAPVDGKKGFRALGAIMNFMAGGNGVDIEEALARLEEKYTNYGCYCWIDGTAGGVTGGGKTIVSGFIKLRNEIFS